MSSERNIVEYPNTILRTVVTPVGFTKSDIELTESVLCDMMQVMTRLGGVGIAAPQIGVNLRLIIVVSPSFSGSMRNPQIVSRSDSTVARIEGCLSFPGRQIEVKRASEILVLYYNDRGHKKVIRLSGISATIVQHEIDHLDGKLFIDYGDDPQKEHV